jgi:hypothetical protein
MHKSRLTLFSLMRPESQIAVKLDPYFMCYLFKMVYYCTVYYHKGLERVQEADSKIMCYFFVQICFFKFVILKILYHEL